MADPTRDLGHEHAGVQPRRGYDPFGNLKTVTDPKGVATATAGDYTTSYDDDVYGELTKATDANGNPTTYTVLDSAGSYAERPLHDRGRRAGSIVMPTCVAGRGLPPKEPHPSELLGPRPRRAGRRERGRTGGGDNCRAFRAGGGR
jgi:YD repeat-containing protein